MESIKTFSLLPLGHNWESDGPLTLQLCEVNKQYQYLLQNKRPNNLHILFSIPHPTDFGCIYETIYVLITTSFVLDAGTLTKTGLFHTLNILKAVKRLFLTFCSVSPIKLTTLWWGSKVECVGFIIFTVSNNEFFNEGMLIGFVYVHYS